MSLAVDARPRVADRALPLPSAAAAIVGLVLLLSAPLLLSEPSNLASDESLYQAEAWNIAHGRGLSYPSGEPVTHRAPLFPAALAPAMKAVGPEGAYAVTRLVIVMNAMFVALLAWRCAGALAAAFGGATAASSAYLSELGTTLYLDPFQCTFLLLAVLAFVEANRRPAVRWFAAGGACVGLAFLVKESALQWMPLGIAAWLAVPPLRSAIGARGALASVLSFCVVVAPWFAWVYAHTGTTYLAGGAVPSSAAGLTAASAALLVGSAALLSWPLLPAHVRSRLQRFAALLGVILIGTWGSAMLYALTKYSSWPYPNAYGETIPAYLWSVAPQMQPYFLIVVAWTWVVWRALRGEAVARLLCIAAALFAPFALFAANRDLQLRDALPLVYLSYVALGLGAASAVSVLRKHARDLAAELLMFAGVAILIGVFAAQQMIVFRERNAEAAAMDVRIDSWDSSFVRESAAWLEDHLPPGSRVLASRLYFSSLYVRSHGKFEVRQMPTVRVSVDRDDSNLVRPASNLFRWGDHELRSGRSTDTWLYLKHFPEKDYWVGLSQQELLEYIERHRIEYVVLTGEDVAFSSLHHARYFATNPAFRLLYEQRADPANHFYVYEVDRAALRVTPHSTAISPADMNALRQQTSMAKRGIEAALGTPIYVTDFDGGLSPREERAAPAGQDLGSP